MVVLSLARCCLEGLDLCLSCRGPHKGSSFLIARDEGVPEARARERADLYPRRVGVEAGLTQRSQSHCREHVAQSPGQMKIVGNRALSWAGRAQSGWAERSGGEW